MGQRQSGHDGVSRSRDIVDVLGHGRDMGGVEGLSPLEEGHAGLSSSDEDCLRSGSVEEGLSRQKEGLLIVDLDAGGPGGFEVVGGEQCGSRKEADGGDLGIDKDRNALVP